MRACVRPDGFRSVPNRSILFTLIGLLVAILLASSTTTALDCQPLDGHMTMDGQLEGSEHRAVFHAGWKSVGRFVLILSLTRSLAAASAGGQGDE
jgi:hypothetical protein